MMTTPTILIIIQSVILIAQISSIFYCIKKNKQPVEVLCGFSIWGSVPNVAILGIVLSL